MTKIELGLFGRLIFRHLKLCLATAIHNFKWLKIIWASTQNTSPVSAFYGSSSRLLLLATELLGLELCVY